MQVIVFSSPGCKLYQDNKLMIEGIQENRDFEYVCHKYTIENTGDIIIKETFNTFILRLFINLITILTASSTYRSTNFIETQYKAYKKNKKIANFVFMPLFRLKGKIAINPLKCSDDTLLCVYLLKSKTPFFVEIYDGEIEILYNTRKNKL